MKLRPLESAREKIARAHESINNLDAEIAQFLKDTEPTVLIGDDQKTGEKTIGVEGRIVPPLRFAVIAGEIIHHLRSSLDHLLYDLIIANANLPTTKTEFPIFVTHNDYVARQAPKVQGVAPAAKALIESLQPFQKGHPAALNHPLWIVHQLDITDKHRLLVVVAGGYSVFPANTMQTAPEASRVLGIKVLG